MLHNFFINLAIATITTITTAPLGADPCYSGTYSSSVGWGWGTVPPDLVVEAEIECNSAPILFVVEIYDPQDRVMASRKYEVMGGTGTNATTFNLPIEYLYCAGRIDFQVWFMDGWAHVGSLPRDMSLYPIQNPLICTRIQYGV